MTKLDLECENLEKLAKLHDMQMEESLRMQHYFRPTSWGRGEDSDLGGVRISCGTPSCSLGWYSTINEECRAAFAKWENDGFKVGHAPVLFAREHFGLESWQVNNLFGPEDRKPWEQAKALRHFIKFKREGLS